MEEDINFLTAAVRQLAQQKSHFFHQVQDENKRKILLIFNNTSLSIAHLKINANKNSFIKI